MRALRWKERGAQFAELALALPILLALVAGAFDFGAAFSLKDKMTNAAREAARVSTSNTALAPSAGSPGYASACASPTTGSGSTQPPCTIVAAVSALSEYMTNAGLNMGCLDPNSATWGPDPVEYTFTESSKGCTGSAVALTIVIDRSAQVTDPDGTTVEETRVTFTYPVKPIIAWFPGFPSQLQTQVTMANLTR